MIYPLHLQVHLPLGAISLLHFAAHAEGSNGMEADVTSCGVRSPESFDAHRCLQALVKFVVLML